MEKRQLIAALVEKTGLKYDEDDPAFLLVDLTLLMLENSNGEAAKNLTIATENFSQISTRNVDDFVTVANEALSKFIQRTNEIKAALDAIPKATNPVVAAPGTGAAQAVETTQEPVYRLLWWLLPSLFFCGVLVGVGLTFGVMK